MQRCSGKYYRVQYSIGCYSWPFDTLEEAKAEQAKTDKPTAIMEITWERIIGDDGLIMFENQTAMRV